MRTYKPSDFLKRGWCQRAPAKNIFGAPCAPDVLAARKWSIDGAIDAAISSGGYGKMNKKLLVHSIHSIMEDTFAYGTQGTIAEWEDELRMPPEEAQSLCVALVIAAEEMVVATNEFGLESNH